MTRTAGELLKELRGARSQRSIADMLGVTPQAVSEWERDKSMPGRATAKALDDLLGAEGQLVAAFNDAAFESFIPRASVAVKLPEELNEVLDGVRSTLDAVRELQAVVDRLSAEVQELRRQGPRPSPGGLGAHPEPGKENGRPRRRSTSKSPPHESAPAHPDFGV
jgi:transcriptional regulator with XRE-family HTH domain